MNLNLQSIFASVLGSAANGAVQALQNTSPGAKVNWQAVGIVAAFGALVGLTQALQNHPAVVTAQAAAQQAQAQPPQEPQA